MSSYMPKCFMYDIIKIWLDICLNAICMLIKWEMVYQWYIYDYIKWEKLCLNMYILLLKCEKIYIWILYIWYYYNECSFVWIRLNDYIKTIGVIYLNALNMTLLKWEMLYFLVLFIWYL